MAVEANDGPEGELLARAELEMKKDTEMAREIERIACRDGDDNDGSGTDGSFVLVMSGGDSDARSDLSDKDIDLDACDCGVSTGDLPMVNSDSSTLADDVSVDEGKRDSGVERKESEGDGEKTLGDCFSLEIERKCDDDGSVEEGAEEYLAKFVESQKVTEETVKIDLKQKEVGERAFKASENQRGPEGKDAVVAEVSYDGEQGQVEEGLTTVDGSMDEKDAAVEELDNKEAVNVRILKNEEQSQVEEEVVVVEDSNFEQDNVIEYLNNEHEAFTVKVLENQEHNQVEEEVVNVENSEIVKEAVIEELDNEDEAVASIYLNTEKENQVEEEYLIVTDSKNVRKSDVEGLNMEDEILNCTKWQATGITEVSNLESEVGSGNELSVEASSAHLCSLIPVNRNIETDSVFDKNEAVESAVTKHAKEKVESVADIQELKKEIQELKKANEQKCEDHEFSNPEKKEADAASVIEKEKVESVAENEELKEANEQKCEEVKFSIPEKKEADASSVINENRNVTIEQGIVTNSATEEISSVSETEDWRDGNHDECADVDCLVGDAVEEEVDSNPEYEECKKIMDHEPVYSDHLDEQENSASAIEEHNIVHNDLSSSINIKDSKYAVTQADENLQSNAAPANSYGESGEASTFVEQVKEKIVNASLPSFEVEEQEHDSFNELIVEPAKIKTSSDFIIEENQIAVASSFGENTEPAKEFISSNSQAGDKYDISLSSSLKPEPLKKMGVLLDEAEEGKNAEKLSFVLNIEPKEDLTRASKVEETVDADATFTNSNPDSIKKCFTSISEAGEMKDVSASSIDSISLPVKEKEGSVSKSEEIQNAKAFLTQDAGASSIDSISLPVKEKEGSGSKSEENQNAKAFLTQDAGASSIDSIVETVKEDGGSASKSAENQEVEALVAEGENVKRELKSATELADVITKPVKDLDVMEDKRKGLKEAEQGADGSRAEIVNEEHDLKSATELAEILKIHLVNDSGEIKGQHKVLKSNLKSDAVHIQQRQNKAALSVPDGDGDKTEMYAKKYRIIRVPKFIQRTINDELQSKKINDAQVQVDEHTQIRESLKAELDSMRKLLSECFHKRDSAIEEEKKAKALVNAKRLEMDSVLTVISKGKTAASFLDIISQIHAIEHKMQHETISLKEEKKYLHELNQLKPEQEHHLFYKCSQSEIDEALKQKEEAESSLRALKKEFDMLRSAHSMADENSKAACRRYIDQFSKVKEQEQKWKAANELRQSAYKNLHGLKSDKMEHHWKYMEDRQAAKKYASSLDVGALERICTEQVERLMRLWNEDDDFRKQYIESNAGNTLRKFGTRDGRSPGPNESRKPLLPGGAFPPLTLSSSPAPVAGRSERKPSDQMARSKSPPPKPAIIAPPPPSAEKTAVPEVEQEKRFLKEKEKEEEDDVVKEREAVELKERVRLEQKAKAREAEERKKRKADKAQARAQYKAQKEAELRLLKRAKKEKKMEGASEEEEKGEDSASNNGETCSQEAAQEREASGSRKAVGSKKRSAAAALNRYSNKAQPLPLPLRNRGRRRMPAWIWPLATVLTLVGLFLAGNYLPFSARFLYFTFRP